MKNCEVNQMAVSDRLKVLRKDKNITQKELSRHTGIPVRSIINYENGLREPNSKAMAALERYFNVSGDYLRGESDDRIPEYKWDDDIIMRAVNDNLDVLSSRLVDAIRSSDDCTQKMAFDILVELRHILSMDTLLKPATMILLQETFVVSTRFVDVCLSSVSSGAGDDRIKKMKQSCADDFAAALEDFQIESRLTD